MPSPDQGDDRSRDHGFTLLEVMIGVALSSVLMAFAVVGWQSYARAQAHRGTAEDVQALLRHAQQRAVTEGSSMCVLFDTVSDSWALYRRTCDDPTKQLLESGFETADGRVHLDAASFVSGPGVSGAGVTFRSRGTASPGQVRIGREGTDTTYIVRVDGLTGRVSFD